MRKNMSIKKRSFRKKRTIQKKLRSKRMRGGRKRSVKKLRGGSELQTRELPNPPTSENAKFTHSYPEKERVYATIGQPNDPSSKQHPVYEYATFASIQQAKLENLETKIGALSEKINLIKDGVDKLISSSKINNNNNDIQELDFSSGPGSASNERVGNRR